MLGGSINWCIFGDVYAMLFNSDDDIEIFLACLIEYAHYMHLVEKMQRGAS